MRQSYATATRVLFRRIDPGQVPLGPPPVNPVVRNGVVELWGTITDEKERPALVVAAENVLGVRKAVRDHLAWVDATSGMVVYRTGR